MAQGGELVPACPLPGLVAQLTSLCLYPVQLGGSGCEQDFAPGLGPHCALFPTLGSFAKLFAGGLRDVREACLRVKAAAQRRRKDEQWTEGCEFLASGKKTNVGERWLGGSCCVSPPSVDSPSSPHALRGEARPQRGR